MVKSQPCCRQDDDQGLGVVFGGINNGLITKQKGGEPKKNYLSKKKIVNFLLKHVLFPLWRGIFYRKKSFSKRFQHLQVSCHGIFNSKTGISLALRLGLSCNATAVLSRSSMSTLAPGDDSQYSWHSISPQPLKKPILFRTSYPFPLAMVKTATSPRYPFGFSSFPATSQQPLLLPLPMDIERLKGARDDG